MRIKDVYLEGYLGLLEGTGRNEIAVDYAPAHAAGLGRILFFGRNGSGKSTFLNAMTPFATQGDGHSFVITPGRPGRKIITFMRDETEIKCDIRWGSKGKASCFMYLNGSTDPYEITAKGNIGEYMRAVEEQLGVTPDFLKMGRVGSRVNSFLDLGPAPRKNFIGQFLPEVEEWANMHKNVAKRVSLMKQQLQGLQVELDRIEPRDELENAKRRSDAELIRARSEISRLDTHMGAAKGALDEMRPARQQLIMESGVPDTDPTVFNPVSSAAVAQESAATRAENQIERLIQERSKLEQFRDPEVARVKAAEISNTVAGLKGRLDAMHTSRLDSRGRLDSAIKIELDANTALTKADGSAAQLEILAVQSKQLTEKIQALEEVSKGHVNIPDDLQYDDIKAASDALMGLEAEMSELRNAFPTPELLDLAVQNHMESDSLRGVAAGMVSTARELQARLDTARSRIGTIEAQAQFHSRFNGMHCNDTRCPFESHIGQFASASEELVSKKAEVVALEARVENAICAGRDAEAAAAAARAVVTAHERIRRFRPVLEAAGVWDVIGPFASYGGVLASGANVTAQILSVTKLLDAIVVKRDLTETRRTATGVAERMESLEALRSARSQLEESRLRASSAVVKAREEYSAIDQSIVALEQSITAQEQAYTLLNQLITLHTNAENGHKQAKKLLEIDARLNSMSERWTTAEAEIAEAREKYDTLLLTTQTVEQTSAAVQLRLARRDEFEMRMGEMSGKMERAQTIADACHPARGAPIEFIKDFLDVTRDTVNEMLDIAMRGEFRIGFSLTDTEFRIPVSKGSGRIIPDVTEASEGQLALAKTVLSLALVKQTIQAADGYNIICFDEIDGMLDRERNRERFAEIVERLSAELGLEQMLMISHNDNFAASPAGIVLFPGHAMPVEDPNFLENKLILARFD